MRTSLLIAFLIVTSCASAQKKRFDQYSFAELLTANNLSFKMPRGFSQTPVIPDNGHLYQFAMKDSTVKFECRLYLRPYALFYDKKDTAHIKDPLTRSFFTSSLLNISGAVLPDHPPIDEYPDYPTPGFKTGLIGDYLLTSAFQINSKFGEGYKYCVASIVRKNGVGEITLFMLFDDMKSRETFVMIDDIFASLHFK